MIQQEALSRNHHQEPGKQRKRRLPLIGGIILGILLLLVFLVLGTRQDYRQPEPSPQALSAAAALPMKLSNAFITPEGKIAAKGSFELTGEELNATLYAMEQQRLDKMTAQEIADAPKYSIVWHDGGLELHWSQPLAGPLAVNLQARVEPALQEGRLVLAVSQAWAGWLPLPGSLLSGIAESQATHALQEQELESALDIFESIRVNDNGNLQMVFYPEKIGILLKLILTR